VPSKKPKALKKSKLRLRRKKSDPVEIVVDRTLGLVFKNEEELFLHFKKHIDFLENEFNEKKPEDDVVESEVESIEDELDLTLDQPSEIWHDEKTFSEIPIFHFIRPLEEIDAYHVVVTFVSSEDEPTFIFLHFVTRDLDLVDFYRRGELVYDEAFEEVEFAMIDGDSLSEGDSLAMGLFISMLKVRSESDISSDKFRSLGEECRESCIEEADEIWRDQDPSGHPIVTFIKEFSDHNEVKDLSYVAVTLEDVGSGVHTLLFSFPTNDSQLLDRYRHGENLQADEVSQESSH
jgi:hypothetical protein